jgi:hypothetical protein
MPGVGPVRRLDHVGLLLPRNAVLRAEKRLEVLAAQGVHDGAGGDEAGIDRGGVQKQPHPPVAQPPGP